MGSVPRAPSCGASQRTRHIPARVRKHHLSHIFTEGSILTFTHILKSNFYSATNSKQSTYSHMQSTR